MSQTKSAHARSQIKHTVVDADGHGLERRPVYADLRQPCARESIACALAIGR